MNLAGILSERRVLRSRANMLSCAAMTDSTPVSDEDLLRRSARGEEQAFTELYRRRQPAVYRFALGMSGRTELAEEVTQDVFLTVIREPHRFEESRGNVSAFLFGIARNFVLRHFERDGKYVPADDCAEVEGGVEGPDVLARLSREQMVETVRQAVLSLPASYREVVVLCDLEELSYAEAADALRIPVGTVRSRLNRGRAMLLEKLRSRVDGHASARCSG